MGVGVAGVNVKGEYRLWSPGSQHQLMFRYSPLRYWHIYIYYYTVTMYMMILFIN